jgi:glucose/arabinose dehydrogenase
MNKKTILYIGIGIIIIAALVCYFYCQKNTAISIQDQEENNQVTAVSTTTKTVKVNGKDITFTIAGNYDLTVAASGLGRTRFMAMSPDNRLFVTDLKDLSDNSQGKIYILSDFNPATKTFDSKKIYLSNLRNPNSVAFYKDARGQQWLYVAMTDKLVRYRYTLNETTPTSEPETIATFPDYGLSYKYGGWHLTRTVAVHNDKVYVAVGSSCNSCEEKANEIRAEIMVMDLDGKNPEVYAKGLRNAVGIKWVGNDFYATDMGADQFGDDLPNEMFYTLKKGTDYGWPYCYVDQDKIIANTTQQWQNTPTDCTTVPKPQAIFDAHAAPLGLEYFDNYFLVALHGSGVVSIGTGNSVVKVEKNGRVSDFITGFYVNGERLGRPVDILKKDNRSFFLTDDLNGVVYYLENVL